MSQGGWVLWRVGSLDSERRVFLLLCAFAADASASLFQGRCWAKSVAGGRIETGASRLISIICFHPTATPHRPTPVVGR